MNETVIHTGELSKSYKVSQRAPGLIGAFCGLFNRRFSTVYALNSLSLTLKRGEILGYIGPNGAGKSTTIKLLSGILVPDSGSCEVLGCVPWRNRAQLVRKIGVVFGQRSQLWWDLPVVESFELLQAIYRIPPKRYCQQLQQLTELLGLKRFIHTPVRQLSLGERMRCELTAALLHEPELLFLDEPTIGLDAVSKIAIRAFIKRLNAERKVSIILTTHDLDDIEALCQRVVLINKGTVVYNGDLDALCKSRLHSRYLTVDLSKPVDSVELNGARVLSQQGLRLKFVFNPAYVTAAALIAELVTKYDVRDIFVDSPEIEEVIAQVYREQEQ